MARAEVPDTTALIQIVRDASLDQYFQHGLASGRIWLSSVVVAELYAGTRSQAEARVLDKIVASVQRRERMLTPTPGDWVDAGRLIARRVRLFGAVRPRDHLADVLIVLSAARLEGAVLTTNVRHVTMWAELARAGGLDVAVAPFPASRRAR